MLLGSWGSQHSNLWGPLTALRWGSSRCQANAAACMNFRCCLEPSWVSPGCRQQVPGYVSGFLSSCCWLLQPAKSEEAGGSRPCASASAVCLYLTPHSISKGTWVLCVCLATAGSLPGKGSPPPSLAPLHTHIPCLMLCGRKRQMIRKQAEGRGSSPSCHCLPQKIPSPGHMRQPKPQNVNKQGHALRTW